MMDNKKSCDSIGDITAAKSNLHYSFGISPKLVTRSGIHFRGLALGQRSSEETSLRW